MPTGVARCAPARTRPIGLIDRPSPQRAPPKISASSTITIPASGRMMPISHGTACSAVVAPRLSSSRSGSASRCGSGSRRRAPAARGRRGGWLERGPRVGGTWVGRKVARRLVPPSCPSTRRAQALQAPQARPGSSRLRLDGRFDDLGLGPWRSGADAAVRSAVGRPARRADRRPPARRACRADPAPLPPRQLPVRGSRRRESSSSGPSAGRSAPLSATGRLRTPRDRCRTPPSAARGWSRAPPRGPARARPRSRTSRRRLDAAVAAAISSSSTAAAAPRADAPRKRRSADRAPLPPAGVGPEILWRRWRSGLTATSDSGHALGDGSVSPASELGGGGLRPPSPRQAQLGHPRRLPRPARLPPARSRPPVLAPRRWGSGARRRRRRFSGHGSGVRQVARWPPPRPTRRLRSAGARSGPGSRGLWLGLRDGHRLERLRLRLIRPTAGPASGDRRRTRRRDLRHSRRCRPPARTAAMAPASGAGSSSGAGPSSGADSAGAHHPRPVRVRARLGSAPARVPARARARALHAGAGDASASGSGSCSTSQSGRVGAGRASTAASRNGSSRARPGPMGRYPRSRPHVGASGSGATAVRRDLLTGVTSSRATSSEVTTSGVASSRSAARTRRADSGAGSGIAGSPTSGSAAGLAAPLDERRRRRGAPPTGRRVARGHRLIRRSTTPPRDRSAWAWARRGRTRPMAARGPTSRPSPTQRRGAMSDHRSPEAHASPSGSRGSAGRGESSPRLASRRRIRGRPVPGTAHARHPAGTRLTGA